MRALWTAATGMKSQQFNIDTIANNLSNVNTTSYKTQRAEFKDLFYTTLKRTNIVDEEGRPVNLQVGHGVMPTATKKDFRTGSFIETDGTFDLAIDGEGFFAVLLPNGETRYTRDGSFKLSVDEDEGILVTSEGYYVLSADEDYIVIPEGYSDISISGDGLITGLDEDGTPEEIGQIGLVKFLNPEGLLATGNNLFEETSASGEYQLKEDTTDAGYGSIIQGFLEMANVQVVEEMVNLITAQRAYEVNTKAIQTSDEMLAQANNLRR